MPRAKKRRLKIALPLAVMLGAMFAPTSGKAHHEKAVPKVPTTSSLMDAYVRLYERAEESPRVTAGRNVLEHGRAKDGRVVWAIVKAEMVRLWHGLHPANAADHAEQEVAALNRAPDWFVQAAAPLRSCEAGGNYATATGNGFWGAYQFMLSTWHGVGGSGYPHQATPQEQDYRAYLLWQRSGWSPWPHCGQLAG